MKYGTALILASAALIGSCYVGNVGASGNNVLMSQMVNAKSAIVNDVHAIEIAMGEKPSTNFTGNMLQSIDFVVKDSNEKSSCEYTTAWIVTKSQQFFIETYQGKEIPQNLLDNVAKDLAIYTLAQCTLLK